MAQMVERVLGKDEVTGSIPVSSSKNKRHFVRSAFCFGNEAHLRCMKNEARLRLMKRAFGSRISLMRFASWRQSRRFTEAVWLLLHIRKANASLKTTNNN